MTGQINNFVFQESFFHCWNSSFRIATINLPESMLCRWIKPPDFIKSQVRQSSRPISCPFYCFIVHHNGNTICSKFKIQLNTHCSILSCLKKQSHTQQKRQLYGFNTGLKWKHAICFTDKAVVIMSVFWLGLFQDKNAEKNPAVSFWSNNSRVLKWCYSLKEKGWKCHVREQ